jgi:hypothetical protein
MAGIDCGGLVYKIKRIKYSNNHKPCAKVDVWQIVLLLPGIMIFLSYNQGRNYAGRGGFIIVVLLI